MRNRFILFLLLIPSVLMAQPRLDKPEVYLGTNFGVTESLVGFHPSVNQTFLMGYNGGFIFRYVGNKYFGMQAELNLSQRGWRESAGSYTRQLNYIEFPFLTHIYFGKKSRVFLNMGPKISYLLSQNILRNTTSDSEVQHTTSIQNPFDYGLCAGIGFLFSIHKSVFQLETRANFGLSDIFSNDKRDYFGTSNNMNASVNLAWMLQVK